MYRYYFRWMAAALFVLLFFAESQSAQTDSTFIEQITADANSVSLRMHSAEPAIEGAALTIPGIEHQISTPGQPALPYLTTLIALPPMATVSTEVVADDLIEQSVDYIAPVGTPIRQDGPTEEWVISGLEALAVDFIEDESTYSTDALYPAKWIEVSEPLQLRDLRFVRVTFYPTRYNPVTGALISATDLRINLSFDGALRSAGESFSDEDQIAFASTMLNAEQALKWAYMPTISDTSRSTDVMLPIGTKAAKIEVNENGIYELSYADLQAAGMNPAAINPATIEMMHHGQSVAYQFIGDTDSRFESNEKIRFYGWKFDGSRLETQYVKNNIFWLWAGGSSSSISTVSNPSGYSAQTTWRATHTEEPENSFSVGYTNKWAEFPNEPDSWYWDHIAKSGTGFSPASYPFQVPLAAVAASGSAANYTVEIMTMFDRTNNIHLDINSARKNSNVALSKLTNYNITGTLPQASLNEGNNQFDLILDTYSSSALLLNRITVEYWANFIAQNDLLEYEIVSPGNNEVTIGGFSSGSPILAWDITDRLNPIAINVTNSDRSGSGPYSYRVAKSQSAESQFIAISQNALKSPIALSTYTANNLQPASGADWLAITWPGFEGEINRLAAHRQSYSGLTTHVIHSDDLINQYGYGLPIPELLTNYIAYGVGNWTPSLKYIVLAGDATNNARQLACLDTSWCGATWVENETVFVPTFLEHDDRFLGMVPSDHGYTMVIGDDLIPDVSIGRLPGQSVAEIATMVDKIILYEANLLTKSGSAWANDILFLSDNADGGGNFCSENSNTAALIPASYDVTNHCVASNSTADEQTVHNTLMNAVNNDGFLMVNYRGHGGINKWATSTLLSTSDIASMTNATRPFVVLSADCLDGHFTWVNRPGMSETIFGRNGGGAAAHWGSSGLGFTFEHTILHSSLINAIFDQNMTRIGDAINFSKTYYIAQDQDESEIWAFTLQGDPAMKLIMSSTPTAVGMDSAEMVKNLPTTLPIAALLFGTLVTFATLTKKRKAVAVTNDTW